MNFDNEDNLDYQLNKIASIVIKEKRLKKGISLDELANKLNNIVTKQSLFRYENNEARMKNNIFKKICLALNENPSDVWEEINTRFIKPSKIDNSDNSITTGKKIIKNNFSSNLKLLRLQKGLAQQELADKVGIDRSTISRIENNEIETTVDNAIKIAKALNTNIADLIGRDLTFDNATPVDISDVIQIPVLGTIKAGVPIEAQQDVLEYIDIPKDWTKGGKKYYGLKISGDSMSPTYLENDIVIFEQSEDYLQANNKDCAVMVNGYDATFKNVTINEDGITLVPLNLNNQDGYKPTFYNKEQVENLPVRIVGIAREKRTRL